MVVTTLLTGKGSRLKDYPFLKLGVAAELESFREVLGKLRARPRSAVAEEACRGSRNLAIAIEEEAWELGNESLLWRQHRAEALKLLQEAAELQEATLAAISSHSRAKVERFFRNIRARRADLAEAPVPAIR